MAFDDKSRYAKLTPYRVRDRRGRLVEVVPVVPAPDKSLLGIHARRQGERLDHLAMKYLGNPAGFWRIAEQNDAVLPDALAEADELEIPRK